MRSCSDIEREMREKKAEGTSASSSCTSLVSSDRQPSTVGVIASSVASAFWPGCGMALRGTVMAPRAAALDGLAAIYAALGESALLLVAEALPVASEAMEDGDAKVRRAALALTRHLEALPD